MKRNITLTSIATIGLLASAATSQAATITIGGNQTLSGPTNEGELVAANNGAGNSATALQVKNGYTLTVESGAIVNLGQAINMSQGTPKGNDGANITQKAGSTVNIGSTLSMSNNASDGNTSLYTMEGGLLDITTNMNVGSAFDATFAIEGSDATVNVGAAINASDKSTFSFDLGTAGVSSIDADGDMTIVSGAKLLVDGLSYEGSANTITLFSFASLTDATTFDVTIDNLAGYSLVYGTDSIYLAVPEPSSFALLGGCFALTSVMLRRRR